MNKDTCLAVVRNIKIPCTFESTDVLDKRAIEKAAGLLKRAGISCYHEKPFVYKKSVDARKKDEIFLIYSIAVNVQAAGFKGCKDIELVKIIAADEYDLVGEI